LAKSENVDLNLRQMLTAAGSQAYYPVITWYLLQFGRWVALLITKVAKVAKVAAMTEQQKAAKPTKQPKVFTGRPVAPAG
jgi:hypothetical protein